MPIIVNDSNFNSNVISELREGTVQDPFVQIEENSLQTNNGRILLRELPYEISGTTVIVNGEQWSEVKDVRKTIESNMV